MKLMWIGNETKYHACEKKRTNSNSVNGQLNIKPGIDESSSIIFEEVPSTAIEELQSYVTTQNHS